MVKLIVTGLLAFGLVAGAAIPEAAARKKRGAMHRLVGMWQCKLGSKVLALGILPNGRLGLETLSEAYRLRPGKLQVYQGRAWVSYPYRLKKKSRRSADRLTVSLPSSPSGLGALGVGYVHMRQRSGRITEFKYGGTLFATALCK